MLTDSERVRTSRRLVMELLGSAVDLSTAPEALAYIERYEAQPERFGSDSLTVAQAVKVDNELYVRDYSKCILCYKCVEACGGRPPEHVRDHRRRARLRRAHLDRARRAAARVGVRLLRQLRRRLPDRRADGEERVRPAGGRRRGDEEEQTEVDTVCPYCGVGCNLTLHVQDDGIVKVTSPDDHDVTRGNLCIKGRFGYDYVQPRRRA